MTDELKAQIKYESARAAQLSKEAITAYEANNKAQGRALMKEAVIASKNCQKLIEQFNQSAVNVLQLMTLPLRQREPFPHLLLYYLFKWSVVSPLLHTYFRGRIYGAENVPTQGPLIAVSNHASYFDPPIISNCLRRPVAYMAKEELFAIPGLKQAITLYGAYPVKRGTGDRGAIRAALNALQDGWIVGVFLEGTRTPDGRISEPKLGAAMMAAKAQVPLLPVSLWGTENILSKRSSLPQPVPITVRIGQAIAPPVSSQRDALEATTAKCAAVINALHDLGR